MDESAIRLLCQDIVQTCLSLAVVGAVERVGHATFGDVNGIGIQKSELVVFCETKQKFAVFVEHVSVLCAQYLAVRFSSALTSLPCPGVRVC